MANEASPPAREKLNRAVLLLGPTAAGKTPLGELIGQRGLWHTRCLHFDFGANLREVVRRNRPDRLIGREDIDFLRDVLLSGALLEDEHFPIARRILHWFMAEGDADKDTLIVLNGLPRHVGQARAIGSILDVSTVAYLDCSSETVAARIANDIGGDRNGRADDTPEAVSNKLAIFRERTAPLLRYYRAQRARIVTVEITPTMTPQQMFEAVEQRGCGFSAPKGTS